MKKISSRGFVLIETLIVTSFVAGVLIFIFTQFTTISKNYEDLFRYNTVEDLYALEDIKNYILSDPGAINSINNSINPDKVIDITNCSIFTNVDYCNKLYELSNIDKIIISNNYFDIKSISVNDEYFKTFINKIKGSGNQKYRLIASFKNSTYATLRFGDNE